jgi:hypothetical protein
VCAAPAWKVYQDDVAAHLSSLGFDVVVDDVLAGARATHRIDVAARMQKAGMSVLWVVECKLWRRRVPKERALTFLGVAGDVGADKGLIFSESGFQAGAISVVENTNVRLTNLAEFIEGSAREVTRIRLDSLHERSALLLDRLHGLWEVESLGKYGTRATYRGPGAAGLMALTGRLSFNQSAIEHARLGRWPVSYITRDTDIPCFADDMDSLVAAVDTLLTEAGHDYKRLSGTGH